jgi:hypothetical protein
MGLIMGTSNTQIDNNVRGSGGAYDQDFTATSKITKHTPGERSYSEITGGFINAADPLAATLSISYQSMVWNNSPYRDFVILEYKVKNTSSVSITIFILEFLPTGTFLPAALLTRHPGMLQQNWATYAQPHHLQNHMPVFRFSQETPTILLSIMILPLPPTPLGSTMDLPIQRSLQAFLTG